MKLVRYLSEKIHSIGGTPLECQVLRYLEIIEVCRNAKNNPRIALPPVYKKLIVELDL